MIVLTSEREAEVQSLNMGAADFSAKPYDAPEIILARIARVIQLYEDKSIITATQYDALTGLYNKEFFLEYATLFDQYYPEDEKEIMVINVNRFHMINAMEGREYGDKVLATIGKSIKEYVTESMGVACRYNADLFCVYGKNEGHEEKLMQAICDALKPLLEDADERIRIGVYSGMDIGVDLSRSLDHAMLVCNGISDKYHRKIVYYNAQIQEKEHLEEKLMHDLDRALSEKQFKVFYQPKYAVQGDKPTLSSAEALVRWVHPELGVISPGKFIPLFEQNGMIGKVDRFVWKEAARQIADWRDHSAVRERFQSGRAE
ncbi:MAG: EAL domain-containing protein [Acetatifactor sp.]|nr:EAL domain-containing protein [Acetatifactor sp.]